MIILMPLLIVLVGILVYLLSTNPKYVELGRKHCRDASNELTGLAVALTNGYFLFSIAGQ